MPYQLTQADLESVTDKELAGGTTRLLPAPDQIPPEFYGPFKGYGAGNVYFRMAEAVYAGDPPPAGEVSFNPGFMAGPVFRRSITAHIRAIDPDYQDKIAGVAYMLSIILTIKETKNGN